MEQLLPVSQHSIRRAWLQALPVILGYLPIGFAFGILANKAGISTFNTMAMSLLVYAGSAQLIAVELFSADISPTSIIITTFIVNLRHMLMSAALSPYLRGWPRPLIALFSYELTDETFGVHSVRFPKGEAQPVETLMINLLSQAGWVTGTFLGIAAGGLIADVKPFGLDYALPAMFIALLVFQIQGKVHAAVAAFGGALSIGLLMAGVDQWNVILATLLAATFGVILETWTKPSSS